MNSFYCNDGATSSFLPGNKGNKGNRARITFISSHIEGNSSDDFLLEQYQLSGDDFHHDDNRKIELSINELTYYYVDDSGYPIYNTSSYNPNDSTLPNYNSNNQERYQHSVTNPPIGQHDSDSVQYVPFNVSIDASTRELYWEKVKANFDTSIDGSFTNTDPTTYLDDIENLPLGNIIKSDAITSLPLNDNTFVGYKFYEQKQLETDSSIGYIATVPNSYMSIVAPEFETAPKIVKRLPEYPEPYDYIIYIDKNVTYLLLIEDVAYNKFYEPIICTCKTLDTWIKSDDIATHIDDTTELTDNLKMYCVNQHIKRIVLDEIATKETGTDTGYYEPVTKTIKDDNTVKNFLITSTNGNLGNYKITAEFVYKKEYTLIVHSIIASRFTGADDTIIGEPRLYDRNTSIQNFDDECLDTFEIIIKNFNDGINDITYTPTIKFYIPESRQDLYDVNIYMYYKKLNGGYNKFLVNSMSYKEFIAWDDLINNKK